jgi:hypothetical protein
MSETSTNEFSAAGSAIGYLAQVEYALLLALERMDRDTTFKLSLETTDDIVFAPDGQPRELWQTKHHVERRGSLGNASPDLWKTLHNWIQTSDHSTVCVLFTTSSASANTVARLLGASPSARDVASAREKLDIVATAGGNAASSDYYTAYLALTGDQRIALLSRITIVDGAVTAVDITDRLVVTVRKAAVPERRLPLVERLRGWWHGRALTHLTRVVQGEADWIDVQEIEHQLLQIAQSLRNDNLPLDYDEEREPTDNEVDGDDRIFVEQLKIILLHHDRIRQAVYDHNRAFLQRSRWQREQLLGINELDNYDRRLVEEWRRVFLPLEQQDDGVETGDDEKRRAARQLYGKVQERNLPEIRTEVRSGYIPFGSLHILADRLQIGWHPDWIELLKHRLEEVEFSRESSGAA